MEDALTVPHLAPEFLAWLWFASDRDEGTCRVVDPVTGDVTGAFSFWVDERLTFRSMEDDKPHTVVTGENPAQTLEARAALLGGRVLKELRLGLRREDREYTVTLRSPNLDIQGARLPDVVKGGDEETLYDRMFVYEELHWLLRQLFGAYARERVQPGWMTDTVPAMQSWLRG